MKHLILVVIALALTGCEKFVAPTGVNSAEALTRYIDKDNGVVCYQVQFERTLSCVKVDRVREAQ